MSGMKDEQSFQHFTSFLQQSLSKARLVSHVQGQCNKQLRRAGSKTGGSIAISNILDCLPSEAVVAHANCQIKSVTRTIDKYR